MNLFQNPRLQLILGLLLLTALFGTLAHLLLRRFARTTPGAGRAADRRLRHELLRDSIGPVLLLIWYYGLWSIAHFAVTSEWIPDDWSWLDRGLWRIAPLGLFLAGLWYFRRATRAIERQLQRTAARTASRWDDVIFPLVGSSLRLTVPILALFLLARATGMPPALETILNQVLTIAFIAAVSWLLRRAILLTDTTLVGTAAPTTPAERALFTRVRVLRKIALAIVMVFAVSAVLMTFEQVRDVGKSLLASAGIAGIVLGFAAQRSLGNLFAGLQIALTQPVRLGDQVLVEGDVGNVEEITLTYVVVRVWDLRRIVLPISYFIEKPFQNWTRVPTNMLAPLVLQVDFSLPIGELRDHLRREIAASEFWDQQVFGVQVTNSDAATMELRVLASAPDAGAAFNLRCELREQAIDFIRRRYPQCLPKQRRELKAIDRWVAWDDEPAATDGNARADFTDRPLRQT